MPIAPNRAHERKQTRFATMIGAIGVISVGLPLVAALNRDSRNDLRAVPGTVWVSGELQGRAVMASAGAASASVGVRVSDPGDVLDVADTGSQVLVFNRTKGAVAGIDPVVGAVVSERLHAMKAIGDQPQVVGAESKAYIIDVGDETVYFVDPQYNVSEVKIGPFDQWVGTKDGRLWLLDSASGNVMVVDETQVSRNQFTEPDADPVLTAVGDDAVIVERATNRIRWASRTASASLTIAGADAIVQEPSRLGTCVAIVSAIEGVCQSPSGDVRSLPGNPDIQARSQIFSDGWTVVASHPGVERLDVLIGEGGWVTKEIEDSSGRRLVGRAAPGSLFIDDPSARWSWTVRNGEVITLEKFSKFTMMLDNGASKEAGFDLTSEEDGATVQGDGRQPVDDNGRNDPPVATDDRIVTRSGRAISAPVLRNDIDPEGDTLAIERIGDPTPLDGGVVSLADGNIVVDPGEEFIGEIRIPYVVTDAGNLTDSAVLTVRVVSRIGNSDPAPRRDRDRTSIGVAKDIDVVGNDRDPEGDPMTVVSVGVPRYGTAVVTDKLVRYTPPTEYPEGVPPGESFDDTFDYVVVDSYGGRATGVVAVTVDPAATLNRAPIAIDDTDTLIFGESVQVNVTGNDDDPDGDEVRVVDVVAPEGIEATIIDPGTVDLRAVADNLPVTVKVQYTIEDPGRLRATATIGLSIQRLAVNRPPIAIPDLETYVPGATYTPLRNDEDPDDDQLALGDVTLGEPWAGSVQQVGTTGVRFVPGPNPPPEVHIAYMAIDPGGLSAIGSLTLIVPPAAVLAEQPDVPPIARDDLDQVIQGKSVTVNVLENDNHPQGVDYSIVGRPTYSRGDVYVNADQTITFVPPSDAEPDSIFTFTYTIRDTNGLTANARVTIKVLAAPTTNRKPIAIDDTNSSTTVDQPILIQVLSNDSDPDGDDIVIRSVSTSAGGTTSIVGSGIRFEPNPGFVGLTSFVYEIADAAGETSSARVSVQVRAIRKEEPIPQDDFLNLEVGESKEINVLTNDIDPDGVASGLTLLAVDKGTAQLDVVRLDNGRVRITAGAVAETFVVTYRVQDPQGLSAFGAIQVQVKPKANTAPIAAADSFSVEAGTSIDMAVLANDGDAEGGQLKIIAVDLPGRITNNGSTVSYDADLGASGVVTLNYTIADPAGATDTSTIRVTVNACTAATPALTDDLYTTGFERARELLLFDNDQNTAGLFDISQPPPGSGTVTVVEGNRGSVVYSPPAGFNGIASFSYAVVNACGTRASATVRVEVNRPPVAAADERASLGRRTVSLNVLENDSDPDNDPLTLVSASYEGVPVSFAAAGVIDFTPPSPPEGVYVIQYTIQDVGGLRATSTLTLSIGAEVNNSPIAIDDIATVVAGQQVSVNTRLNDSDPDDDVFSIESIGAPVPAGLGAAAIDGLMIVFTANGDASGIVTIPYTIIDARGASATANVIITITEPPNTAPVARPDPYNVLVGSGVNTFDVLMNDGDADPGDRIFIIGASVADPAAGTVVWNDAGLVFTLADGYGSDVQISYQISDSKGATDSTTVSVTVTP